MSETIAPAFAGLHSPQLLPFDPRELRIFWSGQRTLALATALTLLVMDMYEHSYHMDHGAAAQTYINALFVNVQWNKVECGLAQAQTLQRTLVGAAS
ncbi:MAG: Fe-Mn family superoxide dismutase [Pseudomonadota bacterium]|nr:Fe-Mn family superoxide dismutase [Pseudomonadota bacterium]